MASLKKHGVVISVSYYFTIAPGGVRISVHSTSEAYGAVCLGVGTVSKGKLGVTNSAESPLHIGLGTGIYI